MKGGGFLAPALNCLEHTFHPDAESLFRALALFGGVSSFRPLVPEDQCYQYTALLPINGLRLFSYRGARAELVVEPGPDLLLSLTVAGRGEVQDPLGDLWSCPGGAMLLPPGSGPRIYSSQAGSSAVAVPLAPAAISRTAAVMGGNLEDRSAPADGCQGLVPVALGPSQARPFHSLLRHIDDCATIDPTLPERLGLDDLILRLVATWLRPCVRASDASDSRPLRERSGRAALDELIDYIRANLDQPLRLSDLEARSFYSRRTLQAAFRDKLGCSPGQWIREQRLGMALQKLQSSSEMLSIRAVALACGYRRAAHFSAEFKRRFGLAPSQVKRLPLR